jgi:hypothetical protein
VSIQPPSVIRAAFVASPLLLAVAAGGCATRSEFTRATGEPLDVVDEIVTVTDTERVEVGTIVDSNNNSYSVMGDRPVTRSERVVYGTQGGQRVDDESFFRIVGDAEAVARYDEYHQYGAFLATGAVAGIGVATAVVATSAALAFTPLVLGEPEPCGICELGYEQPINNLGWAAIGGSAVALLAMPAAVLIWMSGSEDAVNPNAHLYDVEERAVRMKAAVANAAAKETP